MNVLQTNSASSSTPVIQGEHAWISLAEMIATNLPKQLKEVYKNAEKELTKRLKAELSSDPQWASVTNQVSVTVSDGEIDIQALSHAVSDLEYGTPEVPMNSKLRPFAKVAGEYLKDEVDKVVGMYS